MDFTLEVVGRTLTFDETKLPVCLLLPLLEEKNCFEGEECEQALNFKYDAPGFEPPTIPVHYIVRQFMQERNTEGPNALIM
jgi:hypothetical protein